MSNNWRKGTNELLLLPSQTIFWFKTTPIKRRLLPRKEFDIRILSFQTIQALGSNWNPKSITTLNPKSRALKEHHGSAAQPSTPSHPWSQPAQAQSLAPNPGHAECNLPKSTTLRASLTFRKSARIGRKALTLSPGTRVKTAAAIGASGGRLLREHSRGSSSWTRSTHYLNRSA